ncbi:hypothetical protein KUL25_14380 [Rhodobacteraceae bacterium N5(2021)]|uniref:Sulfotransferase family protein n=1 Tax=Gymnodinialimonas phycosphaerae TaxID=2841589 RepID=A0A975YEQ6_9RHOB|nr:hypothetical protein [Gymnodinialimonas phycosphaerae]MBY4893942.1 hypothetical protein [Gymnodinialimonas phycosphaerae]
MARYHLGIAKHPFIHIPKNGGMTIRNSAVLRKRLVFADPYFHISPAYTRELAEVMAAGGYHHGNQHARLIDIHPTVRARLQPVAIVCNPWKRTFSRFTYLMKAHKEAGEPVDYSPESFERFLEQRHDFGGRKFYWHRAIAGWYPQVDYVQDETGTVACDILRLEALDADVAAYFGVTNLRRKNDSGTAATSYTEVYTDRTIQIVADWYARDIDTFGFDFIGGAKRNTLFGTQTHGA